MRRAERGMTSVLGMMILGIMLLAACGLLTLERQQAQAGRGYEDEVRLRLLAQSEAERAASQMGRVTSPMSILITSASGWLPAYSLTRFPTVEKR